MAFKAKSASETKAAELASALQRKGNPRLTPLAICRTFRKHRNSLDAALAERGYVLVDYADQEPGRGVESM